MGRCLGGPSGGAMRTLEQLSVMYTGVEKEITEWPSVGWVHQYLCGPLGVAKEGQRKCGASRPDLS
jgi:hypothetical protein